MSGLAAAQPSSPRASLPSLPNEILTSIIAYSGKATALSLARVCRRFTPLADAEIWRDLELRLPQNYGHRPFVLPHAPHYEGPYSKRAAFLAWESEEEERVENRCRAGLKEKMKTVLLRMDARRAGAVKAIRLLPGVGAVSAQIQILELASSSLEVLEILPLELGLARHYWQDTVIKSQDTLDFRMIGSGLFLPSLKHVVIGSDAIYFMGFLALLFESAPNVTHLDLNRSMAEVDEGPVPPFSPLQQDTKLEQLRIWHLGNGDMVRLEGDNTLIIKLLQRSPMLRALALDPAEFSEALQAQVLEACNALQHLRMMFLPGDLACSKGYSGEGMLSCRAQHIAYSNGEWWHPMKHLPDLPNATTLYLTDDNDPTEDLAPPAAYPEPIPAKPMIFPFVSQLRRCTRLHTIYSVPWDELVGDGGLSVFNQMEEIEELRKPTVTIRSIIHNGAELLHARWLQLYSECWEADHDDMPDLGENEPHCFDFVSKDGSKRCKLYRWDEKGSWCDYTDFDGHCVPLEILAEMRRVQGASQEEWVGRGIEAGEAAWKVLTDWRDKQQGLA